MRRAIKAHLGDFVALIALFAVALGVSGYIVFHQFSRPFLPLIEAKPFKLNIELPTAQAVTPGQGQSVRVAGVQVGKITGITLERGVGVVQTQLDRKWIKKLKMHSDATALLRPRTGLKDMFIELDPGARGPMLKDGDTIPVSNTAPDVNADEILSTFDSDTRAYLQLLINSAGLGLKNRGNDLNATFKALGPTNADLKRLTQAVAQRHNELSALIHEYGDLTNTLADRDQQIRTLVNASDAVFRAFASQNQNISTSVALLPPTLRTTQATLNKVNVYAPLLRTTLAALEPPFRQLNATNHAVLPFMRIAYPIIRNQVRPFVRVARPYVRQLRPASTNLAAAAPDLVGAFHELNRFFDMLAYNPQGKVPVTGNPLQDQKRDEGYLFWLAWLGHNTTNLFSTSDANGVLRRALFAINCTTIRQQLDPSAGGNPLAGPLLGLSNALNDPGLCPSETDQTTSSPFSLPATGGLVTLRGTARRKTGAGAPGAAGTTGKGR